MNMDTLPEIPRLKQSLTGKQSTRSSSSMTCFEDSGLQLDLRESLASTSRHSGNAGGIMRPQSPAGTRSPNPPASLRPSTVSPRSVQNQMRRSLDSVHVRLSRNEFNRKEQLINSLRADNLQLQQKVRELEHSRENSILLQSVCSKLAQSLDCNIEGVAADSVHDILRGRITKLTQEYRQATQQIETCRGDLERSRGELAATNVRCTNLETQVTQSKNELERREHEIKQIKSDMETLQQTCARTGATVQSLRQQLAESEGNKIVSSLNDQLTQLQTEVGRLKNELLSKSNEIEGQRSQLSDKQVDLDSLQERAATSDTMYADLCAQLEMALQMESTDSFDAEYLISQVSSLQEECLEQRLRMETITKSMKTVELDSKASRETILRLVSEAKKHEAQVAQIKDLQCSNEETKSSLCAVEREKEGLEERLLAAKETLLAQEKELQAKESKVDELSQSLFSLQRNSESERSLTDSAEQKYQDLCASLAAIVGVQTKDSSILLSSVEQLIKDTSNHSDELSRQSTQLTQLEQSHHRLQEELAHSKEALSKESASVKQMKGERMSGTILNDGLAKELEKHKAFTKRLSRAVNLDTGTAEILSGDFAHDAILTKAEQLAKQETQLLAERQTAMYSLQRKLKTCRQTLDSKELHLGLVQKKVTVLEERILSYSKKEGEWENSIDKMRKMEKQMERLQSRAAQQRETITQLEVENADVQRLKTVCSSLEDRLTHLSSSLEEVMQARVQQAQQLAEARQRHVQAKTLSSKSPEKAEIERLQSELATAMDEIDVAKQKETELCAFKTAVKRLLKDEPGTEANRDAPDDYNLIARLEKLLASQLQYKETTKCLEASLKQLESGFKSSYNDALTLLASETSSAM